MGVDQLQHLELANNIAGRFNSLFKGDYFPELQYVEARFPKIMSLTDPKKKMSKSDKAERSRINLTDSETTIRDKIRRAVTDSEGDRITHDP